MSGSRWYFFTCMKLVALLIAMILALSDSDNMTSFMLDGTGRLHLVRVILGIFHNTRELIYFFSILPWTTYYFPGQSSTDCEHFGKGSFTLLRLKEIVVSFLTECTRLFLVNIEITANIKYT